MMDTMPLSRPLSLFEGYSATEMRRSDIPRLRDTPILDWNGKPLALELLHGADERCEVHTVNELQDKMAQGFCAATTLTIRLQGGYFDLALSILDASQLAASPAVSFLDNPYVSIGALDLVPARLIERSLGEDGITQRPHFDDTTGGAWQSVADSPHPTVKARDCDKPA